MRVLVLHSDISDHAPPDELDTLVQARWVADLLASRGHSVTTGPFRPDQFYMKELLGSTRPDCIFNLVETVNGSGKYSYLAAQFCEQEGIPYTGSSARTIFITSNKCETKTLLASKGLPVPRTLWPSERADSSDGARKAIIKPLWEDGSVGLTSSSVINLADLDWSDPGKAVNGRFSEGELFVEEYVEGREFKVSLISLRGCVKVLPVAEILFRDFGKEEPKILDYEAKWCPESPSYKRNIREFGVEQREPVLAERLTDLSLLCWQILKLRGYARIDFRVDKRGQPWIIEVNANPCLSPDAGFMAALGEAGIDPEDAVESILVDSMMRR
ncbi:D-alanine--D-alanine ligase family protein [Thermodesulforhabdus norvegica]|uniref:D-alanine-D-alanine ligase n=1 Tax=Thermodesulforhabdus norvegica TaxID=39841 RepID=A0A1I4UDD4_9BACT|nr:ATP-grasp domain-containing protein [Thermodesulforhabdus norvegica]SFM86925.1 D-alanine-D-alanine ligase [Thermodesulforhabdus norvegica]